MMVTSIIGVAIAILGFSACRTVAEAPAEDEEIGLVWEAWDLIKNSYVEVDTLDSQEVVGSAILRVLEEGEKPAYPFLTRLDEVSGRSPRNVPVELVDVWKAWTLFRSTWPEIDPKTMANAAVEGMLEGLGDRTAVHLNPELYQRAQESLSGVYQGIGANVAVRDGKMVLSPMDNSPALRAGVEVGDVVLEVNGASVDGKSIQDVIEEVRGPAGSPVKLLVERQGEDEPLELDVVRGDIGIVSVQRQLLPGAIGYVWISDFQGNTPEEILTTLEEMRRFDMLALILDLRSNPGGSIESAQQVASQFLPTGLFMYEVDREGTRKDWEVEQGGWYTDAEALPMIVIVNEITGNVAEMVAGALQDGQRATILGTLTVGRGSASEFRELSDGSALYIPVARWYTPSGRLIQGVGISPDIEVPLSDQDRLFGVDSQLAEAYQLLDDQLPDFR